MSIILSELSCSRLDINATHWTTPDETKLNISLISCSVTRCKRRDFKQTMKLDTGWHLSSLFWDKHQIPRPRLGEKGRVSMCPLKPFFTLSNQQQNNMTSWWERLGLSVILWCFGLKRSCQSMAEVFKLGMVTLPASCFRLLLSRQ